MLAGTRLYYAFYDSAIPTEEKFMERVDALTREIGDRAKLTTPDKKKAVSEGVPPSTIRQFEPAPAPQAEQAEQAEQAPAPAPAPASEARSALTSAATAPMTPQSSYSPSMQSVQQQPGALSSAVAVRSDGGSGGATAAAGSFAVCSSS